MIAKIRTRLANRLTATVKMGDASRQGLARFPQSSEIGVQNIITPKWRDIWRDFRRITAFTAKAPRV
jgi:hypothetical protein